MHELTINQTKLVIKQGDITQEIVDVIVNAANSALAGGGGVDGAIHRAAGPSILEECAQFGGCPTGGAVITGAGNLRVKHILHTVGPVWEGGEEGEDALLRSAYQNSLALASLKGCKSIAFPSISTGAYGYPIQDAAPIAMETCVSYVRGNPSFEELRFVLFSDSDEKIYQRELEKIRLSIQ